jgi:DNA polymerase III alpha subunit
LLRKTLSSRIQPINKLITTTNERFIPALINNKRIVKKGASIFVFLEVSDETGIIDVSVPIELHDEKKPLFKENGVVMIKGTVVADDFRKGNFEDVGIKIRATDVMPIELARSTVTSSIRLDVSRTQLKELGNGKFEELKALNDPNGINVVFYLKDDNLNISSEVKVDSFKVSLEDSTFEKINEIFGEENYKLF